MMTGKGGGGCCGLPDGDLGGFKVESLVSVDERGQMVLPKDVRDKAGIVAGDKFAVVSWVRGGKVCCLSLIRVDELTQMVKDMLGPLMQQMMQK